MTIEQEKVVDFIGTKEELGKVALGISDHLEWDEKNEKLLLLQEKLNSYLAFIESGEILKKYPKAKGKKVLIELISKYPPSQEGLAFLERAKGVIEGAGFEFGWKVFENEQS